MSDKSWRLNPSYLPMQLLDWLSSQHPDPVWQKLAASSLKIILESAPRGFAPDWIIYEDGKGFRADDVADKKAEGGYDAIRVYMWAGMLDPDAPSRRRLLAAFAPMAKVIARLGYVPESVNIITGETSGRALSGFSSALLPFLSARGERATLKRQRDRLAVFPVGPDAYYEQVLGLFAHGWMDKRYSFTKNGGLRVWWYGGWYGACVSAASPTSARSASGSSKSAAHAAPNTSRR